MNRRYCKATEFFLGTTHHFFCNLTQHEKLFESRFVYTFASFGCFFLTSCDESKTPLREQGSAGSSGMSSSAPDPTTLKIRFEALALPNEHRATQLNTGNGITEAKFLPGRPEFLLLEKTGNVFHYRIEEDGKKVSEVGRFMLPNILAALDCGLISTTFDPDWTSNHFVYFGHCYTEKSSRIVRVTFDGTNHVSAPSTAAVIMEEGDPTSPEPWHNVGSIGFFPDKSLWALFGDKVVFHNAQDLRKNLGKVVRVIPNREVNGSGYTPYSGNPFRNRSDASPDVYAYGLRSPWRGSLDSKGRIWFGDVGQITTEEVNVVKVNGGNNFGWGTTIYDKTGADGFPIVDWEGSCKSNCKGLTQPLTEWPHNLNHRYLQEDSQAVPSNLYVAWVGQQYRPGPLDRYHGLFDDVIPFGDYCHGYVRVMGIDDSEHVIVDKAIGHLESISSWDQGPDGYFYVTTLGSCSDWRKGKPGVWRVLFDSTP